jgi:hypothetical protein
MPTIIDSLIVTLGLDSSEFDGGRKKVDKNLKDLGGGADKTTTRFKKLGKDGGEGFDKLAKSAGGFLALLGGTVAVKRFIEQTIDSNAALDRFAQNLNSNVSEVSAWANATELAGGDAAGLQGTLDMLSRAQTELQLTGQSGLVPYLSALGVSMSDLNGKGRPVNEMLLDLADKFSKLDRPTAFNMGRMMGIDPGTMNLLLKGRSEVEGMIAQQKQYNAVTKEQAEASARLWRRVTEMRQEFGAFGRELVGDVTPALEGVFSVLSDVGAWVRDNKETVKTFLAAMAVGLGTLAAAVIPINLTVLAVTGLSAAIAALYEDYKTWKRGGESFIDWAKWEPGIKAAGDGVRWLKDLIEDMIYRAIAAGDVLAALWSRDWKRLEFAVGEFKNGTGKKYGEPSPPSPAPLMDEKERERGAMEYFQEQGWTKEQAAGIVANIKRESAFKPDAVGDNGKAYGIAQWHPDRQEAFKKYFGKDIKESSFEDQLAFINFEMTEGNERAAGNKLRQASTAKESAEIVSKQYERPAATDAEALERGNIAVTIAGRYGTPASPPASPVLAGIPGASVAAQGAGASQVAAANAPVSHTVEGDRNVETHIGEIKIYSAATDAQGIARDMGNSMDFLFNSQANYGLF